jgi:hypothetical protein
MFEQDDVENWVSLTSTAAGSMARRLLLNSRMGLLSDGADVATALSAAQFAGPGSARVGYSEHNQRALLNRWADDIATPVPRPGPTQIAGIGSAPMRAGEVPA